MALPVAYDKAFALAALLDEYPKSAGLLSRTISAFDAALILETSLKNAALLRPKIAHYRARLAQTSFNAALAQQFADRPKEAETLYLEAAASYIAATKGLSTEDSVTYRQQAAKIMDTVEQLRLRSGQQLCATSDQRPLHVPTPTAAPAMLLAGKESGSARELVVSGVGFTEEEKAVLKRSSWINGRLYVPWMGGEEHHEQFKYGKKYFIDPEGTLRLSPPQRKALKGWARPSKMFRNPQMIVEVSPFSITQELVTDCSFVSSLCIAAAYERRFRKRLITNIIYPQDATGRPLYNPSGKYMVKLWFNGVARKVVVDDRLPVDAAGNLICSFSRNRGELWVSILEKAFVKLHGGYDFPGSNSGIDLYALTGWLPETVHLRPERSGKSEGSDVNASGLPDFNHDRVWTRLLNGSRCGDVLITVATGQMDDAEAKDLGLVPTHAYAVLEVREAHGHRLLKLKNPWAHLRWRGAFSPHDTASWTPSLRAELRYDQVKAMRVDNGIFWINYSSLLRYFTGLYLNWNMELFREHTTVHRNWPKAEGPINDSYNLGYNPQYELEVTVTASANGSGSRSPGLVWVVLTRHVTSKDNLLGGGAADASGIPVEADFLTLHVYRKQGRAGRRIYHPSGAMHRGTYSNNPHNLLCFEVPLKRGQDTTTTTHTLVVSQYEKHRDIDYTLSVYSNSKFRLGAIPRTLGCEKKVVSEWGASNAGGSGQHASWMTNPQFRLSIVNCKAPTLRLRVRIEVPRNRATNVRLFKSSGRWLSSTTECEQIASSGDYRQGFTYFELNKLPRGEYTLVPSLFNPGGTGRFALYVESNASAVLRLEILPPEGAGLKKHVVSGTWSLSAGTAAGCTNHGRFHLNPQFAIRVTGARKTATLFRVHVPRSSKQKPRHQHFPSVNVSIFRTSGPLPPGVTVGQAIGSSNEGVYTNPPSGAATSLLKLERGDYVALVSTFTPVDERFVLTVYGDVVVAPLTKLPRT